MRKSLLLLFVLSSLLASVAPAFARFLERFPTFAALAEAPRVEVLRAWAGLGYNRRAINLQERFFISKDNPDHLHDEITTIDNALTRPWTVLKTYRRERNAIFSEGYCAVDNPHVKIGNENYMLGADGLLMPAKKGQKPPDLRYFK